MLGLTTLAEDSLGLALGTANGVVKRVNPEVLGRDSWEVIRLDPGDQVVGAVELTSTEAELVFVSDDAQLLHFPASAVRPQGRSGGGMAGIKLGPGARASSSARSGRRGPGDRGGAGHRRRHRPRRCPAPTPGRSR